MDRACVYGCATVTDRSMISDRACVDGNAIISENARIEDAAVVCGNAKIKGWSRVIGDLSFVAGDVTVCKFAVINSSKIVDGSAVIDYDIFDRIYDVDSDTYV